MSFSQAALANQKLTFARLALKSAQANTTKDGTEDDIHARLAQHAQLDAGINHLSQALAFFLREVAEQYKAKIENPAQDPTLIFEELRRQHAKAAEVIELQTLFDSPSWLRDLIAAARDPRVLAAHFKAAPEPEAGLIPLRSVANDASGPADLLANWLQNLQLLIDRLRTTLIEE